MEGYRMSGMIMDERCPDCEVKEKLKDLQVLRYIMMTKRRNTKR